MVGMAILPRPAPTRAGIPRPVEVTGRLRVTKIALIPGAGRSRILLDPPRPASTIITKLPLGFSYINPSFHSHCFFCPDSLTQPFTPPQIFFLPSLPHAAAHQPPLHSPSRRQPPASLTQLLTHSRRRSSSLSHAADPRLVTPQISRSSLSHAAALHYNPILGAGRCGAERFGSGAG